MIIKEFDNLYQEMYRIVDFEQQGHIGRTQLEIVAQTCLGNKDINGKYIDNPYKVFFLVENLIKRNEEDEPEVDLNNMNEEAFIKFMTCIERADQMRQVSKHHLAASKKSLLPTIHQRNKSM